MSRVIVNNIVEGRVDDGHSEDLEYRIKDNTVEEWQEALAAFLSAGLSGWLI